MTDKLVEIGPHYTAPQVWRTEHKHFALASKECTLESFTTLMDYCLRTRDMNVVNYLGVIS